MSDRFSAAEIFSVIKDFPLAQEKVAAIEQAGVDSPSLVVAGAGSGKTELLSVRVLYLVANCHARPEQILGLTFTKKAATELSKRIFESLVKLRATKYWPEDLEIDFTPPTISTYNAFANQIFRENALALGYEPESKLLTDAARFQLAREVCIRYGSNISGSLSDLEMDLDPLVEKVLELSQSLNDHGQSLESVSKEIDQALEILGALPKKAGEEVSSRNAYMDEMLRRLGATPLIAELAKLFQEEKKRRSQVDYSDQVALAYRAISSFPAAKNELRNRYAHVMLDEYQDTSVLQTRLLSELFGSGSVFAVGDPNQSIYGWRGASSNNLNLFSQDFGSAKLFKLETSWRNPTKVLDLANLIAEPLSELPSYEVQDKKEARVLPVRLRPKDDAPEGEVAFAFEQTIEDEAEEVAKWIKPGVESGLTAAVLMRKRASMKLFVEKLQDLGIEVEVVGLGGLMELPEIVDLISALRVIQRADAGTEVIRLLTGARWRIGLADIDRLHSIAGKLSGPKEEGVFRQQLGLVEALDACLDENLNLLSVFSDLSLDRLRDAADLMRRLRQSTALELVDFVRIVAEELWLDIELRANPRLKNPTAQLQAFFEIVSSFGQGTASSLLGQFLNWLDYAKAHERFELPRSSPRPNVVQVMTVHSAKGLEWDMVAIPNLVEDDFPAKSKNVSGWVSSGELPYPLRGDRESLPIFGLENLQTQTDANKALDRFKADNRELQLREENRLIYVAITRTRQKLLLTGSYWKGTGGQARKPSRYLEALLPKEFEINELEENENPLKLSPKTAIWPLDPVGESHGKKLQELGREAAAQARAFDATKHQDWQASSLHEEIHLLLREQDDRLRRLGEIPLPVRIPASKFKDFVSDVGAQADRYLRPVPQEPYRATRAGTLFHTWVEEFLVQEEAPEAAEGISKLTEIFRGSRFANQRAVDVEIEINLTRNQNTFVCKIDAVFETESGFEIVDWKTGEPPKTERDLELMTLQLALYRFAYSKLKNIPIEKIEVCFYFVSNNQELRPKQIPTPQELMKLWSELFA